MPTPRTYFVNGERTSLRLEAEFVSALDDIAAREATLPGLLIERAVTLRPALGRTSATRVFVMTFYRDVLEVDQPPRRASVREHWA